VFIAITTSTLIALSFLLSNSFSNLMIEKELRSNQIVIYNINQHLEEKYKLVQTILFQAYMEKRFLADVFSFLENDWSPYSAKYLNTKPAFDNYINSIFSRDPDIAGIFVFKHMNDTVYQYTRTASDIIPITFFERPERLQKLNNIEYNAVRLYPADFPSYFQIYQNPVYTMNIQIKSINSEKNIGTLMIDFTDVGLKELISRMRVGIDSRMMVFTDEGNVVFDSEGSAYEQNFAKSELLTTPTSNNIIIDGERVIVNKARSDKTGLTTVSIAREKNVLAAVKQLETTIYLTTALLTTVCILLMFISSQLLSKRIRTITQAMRQIRGGDLTVKIPLQYQGDEIDQIASSLNRMSESLNEYIKNSYISEIRQKNAELTALQAQINPHFLYNTLEAIRMKAVANGDKDVGEMIYIVADLFRSAIKSSTVMKVADEIDHCEQYLKLFRIRYGESFSYVIDIDPSIRNYGFIKHILQPIFENYIIHGFTPRKSSNQITLHGQLAGKNLVFTIEDNGRGIPPDRIKEIENILAQPDLGRTQSIGLANVNERIKLIFGMTYGLAVQSDANSGTTVTITIPAMEPMEMMEYVQSFNRG
jgi:two-component system sensor histidine kinase YesM